jgi:hypothetical protein
LPLSDILSPSVFSNTLTFLVGRHFSKYLIDKVLAIHRLHHRVWRLKQSHRDVIVFLHRLPVVNVTKRFQTLLTQNQFHNFFMAVINSEVNKASLFVKASNGKDHTYPTMEFTMAAKSLAIQAPG